MDEAAFFTALAELGVSSNTSGRLKHELLREFLATQIVAGNLRPGLALPSEPKIAEALCVARNTVRQAMATLEQEGLVRRLHGKGTFVHNPATNALPRRHDLWALITPQAQGGFYPAFQRRFEEAAAELHNQVIVCNSGNDVDKQGNSILQLIDRHVAGVVIVPTSGPVTPAYHVRQLQERGIPVVCCSRGVAGVRAPLLAIPFEDVGRRAAEALWGEGHRQVAFFGVFRGQAAQAYERGFRAKFEELGGDPGGLVVFYGQTPAPEMGAHEEEIDLALGELLEADEPPTAIFASFDSLAELIYIQLGRRGVRVPEEISLIGFGGIDREGAFARRLASVTIDETQLARSAARLLQEMREGRLRLDSVDYQMLPLGLSPGQTLAAPGTASSLAVGSR